MIADFVGGIFDVVAEVTTGLGTTLTAVFGMVYGGEPAALTPLGMVLIIIVGAPMAWGLLNYVIGLFRSIRPFGGKKR